MENFNANGQKVFIEPTWITGETCLFTINNPIQYAIAKTKITEIRKEFIKRLEQDGFIITFDKKDLDVVTFIMNDEAICEKDVDTYTYKKEFDQRMFEAGGEKLNYPYTLSMEEYFQHPFYPAVLKNEIMNGGIDKFFIENEEQLEIIKQFYNDNKNNPDYFESFQNSIFQQYIETPTNNQTYIRVLMSASKDVMGASLKYSKNSGERRQPNGLFEKHFWNPQSKYFLNCKGMFNYYSEGGNINLFQPKFSGMNRQILQAHNIDPDNVILPDEILEVASSIMEKCNRELGIICGFDFLLNAQDNKWYYLENQAFPAIDEWAVNKGIKKFKNNTVDDYINYMKIELEARYAALMMYMQNKLHNKSSDEEPKKYELKKLEA